MSRRFSRLILNGLMLLVCTVALTLIFKQQPTTDSTKGQIQRTGARQDLRRSTWSGSTAAVAADSAAEPATTSPEPRPSRARSIQAQTSGDSTLLKHRENQNQPDQPFLSRNTQTRLRKQNYTTEVLGIHPFESPAATPDLVSEGQHQSLPAQTSQIEEAKLPIALILPETTLAQLTPQEQAIIEQVQQTFAQEISTSPSQDPESPEYFSYWRSAQSKQDDQLRIMLGWDGFNRLSALAAQKMISPPP